MPPIVKWPTRFGPVFTSVLTLTYPDPAGGAGVVARTTSQLESLVAVHVHVDIGAVA